MAQTLKPGIVLHERYKIVKRVGQGGMGTVYLADDLRLQGRNCAIKQIISDVTADAETIARDRKQFHKEASVLARLDHPNLPKVSDFFSQDEFDYLVMDYVDGQNLEWIVTNALAQEKHLPESEVLTWAQKLGDVLAYLHNQTPPVLHRDIKPSNIKITSAGTLKLVDFGLVKLAAPDDVRTITVFQGRGTVMYTPLEQYGVDLDQGDVRSDIYSFGATLYHLLTGQPPADARQRFLQPGSLVPPRTLNAEISLQTEQAIVWAMEMHPEARPPDVATLMQALAGSIPARTQPAVVAPQVANGNGWLYAWQKNWGLVLLVLTLLIIAAMLSIHAGSRPIP